MKGTNGDVIKGRVTKYLETAVERSRKDYMKKEEARLLREVVKEMEILEAQIEGEELGLLDDYLGSTKEISWKPEIIRQYMKECIYI